MGCKTATKHKASIRASCWTKQKILSSCGLKATKWGSQLPLNWTTWTAGAALLRHLPFTPSCGQKASIPSHHGCLQEETLGSLLLVALLSFLQWRQLEGYFRSR